LSKLRPPETTVANLLAPVLVDRHYFRTDLCGRRFGVTPSLSTKVQTMTTVATRAWRIAQLEGFQIIIKRGTKTVPLSENGILGSYPYEKMAQSKWSIGEWKQKRFEAVYDGFTCDVLMEDGTNAKLGTTLEDVRTSYEE